MANINNLFNVQNDTIKFVDDYGTMILEAKRNRLKKNLSQNHQSKSKGKKSPLELREEFINEIKNDEKNINKQIFEKYFLSHSIIFSKRFI